MQINSPAAAEAYNAGELRDGTLDSRVLLKGKEGSLNNYRLSYETAETAWATPRHRHNFDQVRFSIAGEVKYGDDVMSAGKVAYFPETVHYGPQVRGVGSITLGLQFGGASGNGFMSPSERRVGFDALSAKGQFAKGVFTYHDEKGQKHNQDAYEAVWEHVRGRKLVYPKPRYENLINMDPRNYEWVPDAQAQGIAYKNLGVFTERALTIRMVKVEPGATLTVQKYPSPQILFVDKGSISIDGATHGKNTAIGLDVDEGPVKVRGVESAELLYVQLPVFDEKQHIAYAPKAA
jgi:hypothetical protein